MEFHSCLHAFTHSTTSKQAGRSSRSSPEIMLVLCAAMLIGLDGWLASNSGHQLLRRPFQQQQSVIPPFGELMAQPSRRLLLQSIAAGSPALLPKMANAADASAPKWLSGKSDPLRPTSKDKPDGTKKDNRYVSCLNDCVPRKQGPPGPNQKERSDCLDDCQIECCQTYEQCTYTIRK